MTTCCIPWDMNTKRRIILLRGANMVILYNRREIISNILSPVSTPSNSVSQLELNFLRHKWKFFYISQDSFGSKKVNHSGSPDICDYHAMLINHYYSLVGCYNIYKSIVLQTTTSRVYMYTCCKPPPYYIPTFLKQAIFAQ